MEGGSAEPFKRLGGAAARSAIGRTASTRLALCPFSLVPVLLSRSRSLLSLSLFLPTVVVELRVPLPRHKESPALPQERDQSRTPQR